MPRIQTWPIGKEEIVLYTEDAAVARAAKEAGLVPFGDCMTREGKIFARQFRGPKSIVKQITVKAETMSGEPILPSQPAESNFQAPAKRAAGTSRRERRGKSGDTILQR